MGTYAPTLALGINMYSRNTVYAENFAEGKSEGFCGFC